MGTGLFLGKLKELAGDQIVPFGLDLAENMVENARKRMPDLAAVVGDAAQLDTTSRVNSSIAFARILSRDTCRCACSGPRSPAGSRPGGYWSLVGGTKAAYPALQAKGDSRAHSLADRRGSRKMDDTVLNPANLQEVADTMAAHGFEVRCGRNL